MNKDHISTQYDTELEEIRTRMLQMGGLVEQQFRQAVRAYAEGKTDLMLEVRTNEERVNALEVDMDERCTHVVARRQPAAGDLRLVMAVLKVVTDLERIGDEAAKIARMAKNLHERDSLQIPRYRDIKHVAEIAVDMLRQSLDAFARLDIAVPAKVVRLDEQVDDEFKTIVRKLITFMMEDPRTISSSLEILWVAKAIERIGDHAKNMSEYVVYLIKGKDVRHVSAEQLEREVEQ